MAAEHHELYENILNLLSSSATDLSQPQVLQPGRAVQLRNTLKFGALIRPGDKSNPKWKGPTAMKVATMSRFADDAGEGTLADTLVSSTDSSELGSRMDLDSRQSGDDLGGVVRGNEYGELEPRPATLVFEDSHNRHPFLLQRDRDNKQVATMDGSILLSSSPGIGSSGRRFVHRALAIDGGIRMEAVYPTSDGIRHSARILTPEQARHVSIYDHPRQWEGLGMAAVEPMPTGVITQWHKNHGDCPICDASSKSAEASPEATGPKAPRRKAVLGPSASIAVDRSFLQDMQERHPDAARRISSAISDPAYTGAFDTEGWDRLRQHATIPVEASSGSADGRAWDLSTREDGTHVLRVLEPSRRPTDPKVGLSRNEHQLVTLVRHPDVDGSRPRRRWTMTTTYPALGEGSDGGVPEMWKAIGSPSAEGVPDVHQSFSHNDNHGIGDLDWWNVQSATASSSELAAIANEHLVDASNTGDKKSQLPEDTYAVSVTANLGSSLRQEVPELGDDQKAALKKLVEDNLPQDPNWFKKGLTSKGWGARKRANSRMLSPYPAFELTHEDLANLKDGEIQEAAHRGVVEEAADHVYQKLDPAEFKSRLMDAAARAVHRTLRRKSMTDQQLLQDDSKYRSINRVAGEGFVQMTIPQIAGKLADEASRRSYRQSRLVDQKNLGDIPRSLEVHRSQAFNTFTPSRDITDNPMFSVQAPYFMNLKRMNLEPVDDEGAVHKRVMQDGSTVTAHVSYEDGQSRVRKISVGVPDSLLPVPTDDGLVLSSYEREFPGKEIMINTSEGQKPLYVGDVVHRLTGMVGGRKVTVEHVERAVDRKNPEETQGDDIIGVPWSEGTGAFQGDRASRSAARQAERVAREIAFGSPLDPQGAADKIAMLALESESTGNDSRATQVKTRGSKGLVHGVEMSVDQRVSRNVPLRQETSPAFARLRNKLRAQLRGSTQETPELSHMAEVEFHEPVVSDVYGIGDATFTRQRTPSPTVVRSLEPGESGVSDLGDMSLLLDPHKDDDGDQGGSGFTPVRRTGLAAVMSDGRMLLPYVRKGNVAFKAQHRRSDPQTLWYAHHYDKGLIMEPHTGVFPEGHPRAGEEVRFTDSEGNPILRPKAFLDRGAAIDASMAEGGGHLVFPVTEGDPRVGRRTMEDLMTSADPGELENIQETLGRNGADFPRQHSQFYELHMIKQAQGGNEQAREELLRSMEPALVALSQSYNERLTGVGQNQIVQAGREAMEEALDSYKTDYKSANGTIPRFFTYMAPKVMGAMNDRIMNRVTVKGGGEVQEGVSEDMLAGSWNKPTAVGVQADKRAITRQCPTCGAPSGQPCRTSGGKPRQVHTTRIPVAPMVDNLAGLRSLVADPATYIRARTLTAEGLANPSFVYGSTWHQKAVEDLTGARDQFLVDVAQSSFDNAPGDDVGYPFEQVGPKKENKAREDVVRDYNDRNRSPAWNKESQENLAATLAGLQALRNGKS